AMAFQREHPNLPGANRMIMAFVNMHSPGLKILATHRLVSGVDLSGFPSAAAADFEIREIASIADLKTAWAAGGDRSTIGAAIGDKLYQLEDRTARGALDVRVLHEGLLGKALGITEEAVREEKHTRYIRGIDAAVEEVRKGAAQI